MDGAISDGQLVRLVLGGQVAAYGSLARRWSASVMAVCHARLGRVDLAEDMTQEALLRGLRALPSLHDPEKFGPWLRGIAVRTCLDWLKASARSEVALSEVPESREGDSPSGASAGSAAACQKSDEIRRLMQEVEQLPIPYRQVLMHYYYQDCTYKQIAEQLGVSVATVNARLTKARQMLRQRLAVESQHEL